MDIVELERLRATYDALESIKETLEKDNALDTLKAKKTLLGCMEVVNRSLRQVFGRIRQSNVKTTEKILHKPFYIRTKQEWIEMDSNKRLEELYNDADGNLRLIRGNGCFLILKPIETVKEAFINQIKSFQINLKVLMRNRFVNQKKRTI